MALVYQDGDVWVEIDTTPALKDKVFQRLLEFCKEHRCWSGEQLGQSDEPQIDAVPMLCEIIDDILKPVVNQRR